jgi:hypothetical protein
MNCTAIKQDCKSRLFLWMVKEADHTNLIKLRLHVYINYGRDSTGICTGIDDPAIRFA